MMQTMRHLIDRATVSEAIVNRPRNLPTYLKNRVKTLNILIDRLTEARATVKDNVVDGESLFRSCLRYGVTDEADKHLVIHLGNLEYSDLIRAYRLEDLRDAIESYLKFGPDFIKYVLGSMDHLQPIDEATSQAMTLLPYAEAGFEEYGFDPENAEHTADPEYIAAKHLLQAYRIYASAIVAIEALQADLRSKMQVLLDMRASFSWGKAYRPEHGPTETLYHATAYVRDLVQNGFSTQGPEGRRGLGNFGNQELISFTHDLELARNIMRTLKEMWMIAHGQVTGNQILGWARSEGIEAEVRQSWKNLTGDALPIQRNADPGRIAILYRYWLAHTRLRTDPVMVSPEQTIALLLHQELSDIGVLACEVKLDTKTEYLHGESEFRVASSQVVSVRQVF